MVNIATIQAYPLPLAAQILLGLLAGYLLATCSESAVHRLVFHARPRQRRIWRRWPLVFGECSRSHYRHGIVHHHLTYARSFHCQFVSDGHRNRVVAMARSRGDHAIGAADCQFGITVGWIAFLKFNLVTIPFLPPIGLLLGPWAALGCLPMLLLSPALSRWIHPWLHRPPAEAERAAPWLVRRLLRSGYLRAVRRHHFLHHKYERCNYNLLLGGDWLLGLHRAPTLADLGDMQAIGILSSPEEGPESARPEGQKNPPALSSC